MEFSETNENSLKTDVFYRKNLTNQKSLTLLGNMLVVDWFCRHFNTKPTLLIKPHPQITLPSIIRAYIIIAERKTKS